MPTKRPPAECPVCGAAVPPSARACSECGADERSGWNEEDTRYDGLDLPESAFAGDETSDRKPAKKTASIFWWIVAVGLAALLTCWLLHPAL